MPTDFLIPFNLYAAEQILSVLMYPDGQTICRFVMNIYVPSRSDKGRLVACELYSTN